MPCQHKFQQDLNLQNLNFQPTRLVVGTFNPAWPTTNAAQWFYGRTDNNYFWEVAPQLQGQASLLNAAPARWKIFCSQNGIAITDLISCINDADVNNPSHVEWLGNYSDKNIATKFNSFDFTNIIQILQNNPSITKIYLTRRAKEPFWKKFWQPIENYCNNNGISCNTLLTPSGFAYYQFGRFKRTNLNTNLTLGNFILQEWKPKW